METKLNIWRSREVTLIKRTMLAKSLGLSQLIYTASMLFVPETVIQQNQRKLFAFLWKNKEIRSSDRFCSLPYLRVDSASPDS